MALLLMVVPAAAQGPGPLGLSQIRASANVTGVELWTGFRPYPWEAQFEALDTLEVELLFTPPSDTFLSYLGNPDISLGVNLSTIGRANIAHLGLTWSAPLFQSPFFVEGTVGLALTDSTLSGATPPDRNVGCPTLLYFAAGLGYQIDENWSVMGTVYHASHSGLCWSMPHPPNRGLNAYGLKVGYSF